MRLTNKLDLQIHPYCNDSSKRKQETVQTIMNPPAIQETWVGKIPWRREWQPTPVSLPGESHEQRSLEGYSPWGHTELDMTEVIQHTQPFAVMVQRQWWKKPSAP